MPLEEFNDQEQDLFEHHRFVADPGQGALRIDKFLMDKIQNASRNKIQQAAAAGSILVNDWFKLETLADHLPRIQEKTGIPLTLAHENKSEHKHVRDYYTSTAMIETVAEMHRNDCRTFGYSFDDIV
jgi:hypothetical protein